MLLEKEAPRVVSSTFLTKITTRISSGTSWNHLKIKNFIDQVLYDLHSAFICTLLTVYDVTVKDPSVETFCSINYVNVNYSVKYSNVDCKYLLFLHYFYLRLKPKQYKNYQLYKKISGNS